MAAPLGFKTFNSGDVLTAADTNGYLMQGVWTFANAAARTAAVTSPQEGNVSFLKDTNSFEIYDGAAWVAYGSGDITGVTAGTGISGGGTAGTVTITNSMATEITAAGDIIVGTGSGTFDNLPIGTTGQILTADTTVSPYKVKWAAASSTSTFVGCSLYSTTGTSCTSGATVVQAWNSEHFDTDSFHSTSSNTSRITIPSGKGGKYLFITSLNANDNSTTGYRRIYLYKNGANIQTVVYIPGSTIFPQLTGTYVANAVVGDYFELAYSQNSGSTQTTELNDGYGQFAAIFLGA